jgi:hypothetical protein
VAGQYNKRAALIMGVARLCQLCKPIHLHRFFVFNAALAMGDIAHVGQIILLQPFVIIGLTLPVNNEPMRIETILFAAAVAATVLIGQRTRVMRR